MPDAESTSTPANDDSRRFAERLHAEIVEEAERRRREDPLLARVERDFERAWAEVAPPGAAGTTEELLLDRVDRLSLIDVDAPLGSKPGIRHVKWTIRKATYWYLRYMSDQLNALHNVFARLLRRMDDRLADVEAAAGIHRELSSLVDAAAAPSAASARAVLPALGGVEGPVIVTSCGAGEAVAALSSEGTPVFGVDDDASAVLAGIDAGLDLRVADPLALIRTAEAGSIGALVIGGNLQRQTLSGVVALAESAMAAVGAGGVIAIIAEDLSTRSPVDVELLAGRTASPGVWARVFERAGAAVEMAGGDAAVVIARVS